MTQADGTVRLVRIGWRAPCRDAGFRFDSVTDFPAPLREQTLDALAESGPYTLRDKGGVRSRVRVALRGRRVSPHEWRGTFRASVTVRRHGRVIDVCRRRTVRWRASVPAVHLTMAGDPGDYIAGGESFDLATPRDRLTVTGTRQLVTTQIGPYSVELAAPPKATLKPGRYPDARRYPFNDGHPGISISGDGRGCNENTGEFTIASSSFDSRGRLRALEATFEQHCEGGEPALRGSISFKR